MFSISSSGHMAHYPHPVEIEKAVKLLGAGDERPTARFWIGSKSGNFAIVGTYDEILNFTSDIAQSLMSWPILNNCEDWFTDSESEIIGKVAEDVRADSGSGATDTDGGGSESEPADSISG